MCTENRMPTVAEKDGNRRFAGWARIVSNYESNWYVDCVKAHEAVRRALAYGVTP